MKFSEASLKKVGVSLISPTQVHLQCEKCEARWSPNILPGGRLPARYYFCPNGCNASAGVRKAARRRR